MRKIAIIAVIILSAGFLIAADCHADDDNDYASDPDMRVFDGKVVAVDTGKAVLTVSGVVKIDFPISSDTVLKKDAYDINLSDIDVGNYVTVQYYRSGSDSRIPLKVATVTVEYDR